MAWNRQDDFHNSRVYGADEADGGKFLGWLRLQFGKLLRAGGEPAPATVLATQAMDDRIADLATHRRQRQTLARQNPLEEPLG